ncbi:transcriptional regulator, RpiR family [Sediminispirochaeta smaragdinae DSM 11293]|uniref:Transcriptional regulator, RpiR family n=2 Tax=Sediminispirochaeta TaxID=1911556 RepID=E1RB42_SEDSS|nr:transcriptional regulator, RpiR family [Sediminispirochaeta smaragdinae DSM 11293]
MDIISTIKKKLAFLPPIQKKIGSFVISNPHKAINMSISSLTSASGARSEASVVKFYKALGFSGYHEFKVTLATEIANQGQSPLEQFSTILPSDTIFNIRKKIFQSAIHVLAMNNKDLEDDTFERIVTQIEQSKRIIVIGYGTSAVTAYDLFVKLSRLGFDCHYTTDEHTTAIILSNPREKDLLFCFSFSGETKNIVAQASLVKGKIPIICISGEDNSQLAKLSDIYLPIQSFETTYRNESIVSRYVQLAAIDIIFSCLAQRAGKDAEKRLMNSRKGLSFLKF